MLANIKLLADLYPVLDVSAARVANLEAIAAEFDAEVADGKIYNVTATAAKDSLYSIQRMFESAREIVGHDSADHEALGEPLCYDLPYSIDGGTIKKAIRSIEAALTKQISASLVASLKLQLRICNVFAACTDELRAVKTVLIKGRKNAVAKVAVKLDTPIAIVVAPIKEQVVNAAEARYRARVAQVKAELEAGDMDINKVAPYPKSNMSRRDYALAQGKHNFYSSLTTTDSVRSPSLRFNQAHFVLWSTDAVERGVKMIREAAAADFIAYVGKLNEKVGKHVAASLVWETNYLWYNSSIDVTLEDGTVQRWNTKTIVNCSVLGTLFNQWPTRLIK
jgi:hypothetical protein